MTELATHTIATLSINQLQVNPWNPNGMTDAEFQELTDEIRRLGRVPKPVVVRPKGDSFEIIDGEHSWWAAKETGLTELQCEIVEADDFEAMLQTYKRNQHGQHSRVREGRMFCTMCHEKEITNAELAGSTGISEGTVRNRVLYARAAHLRNNYADEERDAEIESLQTRQVRLYVDLPAPVGDLWLDAGGSISQFGKLTENSDKKRAAQFLVRLELLRFLDTQNFQKSFARLADLAEWLEQHEEVHAAADFVRPIAETELPSLLAWVIPIRERNETKEVCIELDSWLAILAEMQESDEPTEYLALEVAEAVCLELERSGIDPNEVYCGPMIEYVEILLDTPDYIRDASHLSLKERVQLYQAQAPAPPEIVERAKQDTIAFLRAERASAAANNFDQNKGSSYVLAIFLSKVLTDPESSGEVVANRQSDRDEILQSFDELGFWCPFLKSTSIHGKPAITTMRERMSQLGTPELAFTRALMSGALPTVAIADWMDAIRNEDNQSISSV